MKRIIAILGCLGLLLSSLLLAATATADGLDPPTAGQTCPEGDGWTKVDQESGTVTEEFGTLTWGGTTLNYDIKDGYTVEICVKAGTELVTRTVVGPEAGTITTDKEISHISYRFKLTPPPPVVEEEPPVVEEEPPIVAGPVKAPPAEQPPTVAGPVQEQPAEEQQVAEETAVPAVVDSGVSGVSGGPSDPGTGTNASTLLVGLGLMLLVASALLAMRPQIRIRR